ncbi:MAG: NmrA/HSCARG family protein [Woeseiaceae bacterium]|nr:NmrA/HSCARG family protein [Woeseiaceae bacterium]
MSRKQRIIAVVGATGAQGGGLVRAILKDPNRQFRARAITRNPSSENAKALASQGAEVVKADLDDERSLKKAFAGAYGAFCVTSFWEHHSPEKELAQAANMAEAAYHADVEHVIWSTLEDTRKWVPLSDKRMPTLKGRYKVPHCDAKGEANEEFTNRDLPVTFLLTSFYWENLIHFGMEPKRQPDGDLTFVLAMANKPLPSIAAEDIGKCALGIFSDGDRYIGKTVGIAGEHLTGNEFAEQLTRALGEKVRYVALEPAAYRALGFPGAEDLGNMFQFKVEFNKDFCAARSVARTRKLNPELKTFAEWLVTNKDRIPIERIAA